MVNIIIRRHHFCIELKALWKIDTQSAILMFLLKPFKLRHVVIGTRSRDILRVVLLITHRETHVSSDDDVSTSSIPLLPYRVYPRLYVSPGVLVYDVSVYFLLPVPLQKLSHTVRFLFFRLLLLFSIRRLYRWLFFVFVFACRRLFGRGRYMGCKVVFSV